MKKFFALVLALVLTLSLCACTEEELGALVNEAKNVVGEVVDEAQNVVDEAKEITDNALAEQQAGAVAEGSGEAAPEETTDGAQGETVEENKVPEATSDPLATEPATTEAEGEATSAE